MTIQLSPRPSTSPNWDSIYSVELTDGVLIGRWTAKSDPTALDTLVRRHGAMVLGVCRRMLANNADAEDAFQVTFLILVRKAKTLISPSQVAGWLHGVAFQVSRRMRADLAKRRRREEAMSADYPAPDQPEDTADLRHVLDEELNRLPDKYRLPIVLCELEGLTLEEAARRLDWPKGTVAGRLSRGRDILRRRLSRRRGVAFPLIALGTPALPGLDSSPNYLPDELVSATVTAAESPDSPTARTAAEIADAMSQDAAFQSWLRYTIVILMTIVLTVAGLQAKALLAGQTSSSEQGNAAGSCH
jgi:RNA polymerase sigma factor (sigma-70 family)